MDPEVYEGVWNEFLETFHQLKNENAFLKALIDQALAHAEDEVAISVRNQMENYYGEN